MPITLRPASLILCCLAGPLAAVDLPLPPGAEETASIREDGAGYALPVGPWQRETGLPVEMVEGNVLRRAWRLPGSTASASELLAPLRAALIADGYEPLLDCDATSCGGFDFRFATEVVPAPEMYVDLTDYRFFSARHPIEGAVSVLASRSAAAGFVQVIEIGAGVARAPAQNVVEPRMAPTPARPPSGDDLIGALERQGYVVLTDLNFPSGTSELEAGAIASLDALTRYLAATPDRRILFVGHTDAVGSLEANRELSRRRADSAARYLRAAGVADDQIGAQGVGYLAPLASNLTETGRRQNRRVEAILLPRE